MVIPSLKAEYDAVKGEILGNNPLQNNSDIAAYNFADRLVSPLIETFFYATEEETYTPMVEVKRALALMEKIKEFMTDPENNPLPQAPNIGVPQGIRFVRDISPMLTNPNYVVEVIDRFQSKFQSKISKLQL